MVEGLKRQEKRWDPSEMDGFAPIDRGESVKLAVDPMYKLEHVKTDADKSKSAAPRLNTLEKIQMREKDYFAANQVLRHIFRVGYLACVKFVQFSYCKIVGVPRTSKTRVGMN